jgi:hypothetical protein
MGTIIGTRGSPGDSRSRCIACVAALCLPEPALASIADDVNSWLCGVLRDTCNWIFNSQVACSSR